MKGKHRKLDEDALRKAVARYPYRTNVHWSKEFAVSVETIRRTRIRLRLAGKRRMPAATINDALRVAETHEFSFEPFASMADSEELQRLACARSDEEAGHGDLAI